jgi:TPR repeat protein
MKTNLSLRDRLAARNPEKALARGHELHAAGEHKRAFTLFVSAAEAGVPDAMNMVGQCYLHGSGVSASVLEAAQWFSRAGKAGHVASQCQLASLHMCGLPGRLLNQPAVSLFTTLDTPEPDFAAAETWARLAAESGSADGQSLLGFILTNGPEVLRRPEEAEGWYAKAAAAKSGSGQLGYGLILLGRAETAEATVAAVDLIKQAAEAGVPKAHYYLGLVFEKAIGLHANPVTSTAHYKIAAGAGVRNAQAKYGLALLEGRGIAANQVEGETWLRQAALAGDAEAAALVGDLYATGGSLPPNFAEASMWYRRAVEAGHTTAARALGIFHLQGAGTAATRRRGRRCDCSG